MHVNIFLKEHFVNYYVNFHLKSLQAIYKAVHCELLAHFWQLLVNLEHLLTRCKLQVHNLQTTLVNLGFWPCA